MEETNFDIRNNRTGEKEFENALRPLTFTDFKGQNKIVENLKIFVQAARMRTESLDHVLLHGPPGLGKTTLSSIIANELNVEPSTLAVAWAMSHPAVTAPIIGPDNLKQLDAYLAAASIDMDASLREQITALSISYDYGIERAVD